MRHLFIFPFLVLAPIVGCSVMADEALGSEPASRIAPPVPEQLLTQMSKALETTTYSGEFTYQYGRQIESYKIIQQVDGERVRESLQSLTGKDDSVSRLGSVSCGTIGRHLLSGARLSFAGGQAYGVGLVYKASVIAQDRVAGRDAWVVELAPKDEYRFGLVLAIDQNTFLPLRYFVYDANKSVALEHTQFVSLSLNNVAPIPEDATNASPERCISETYSPEGHSPWKPTWLPPGFILTGYVFHSDDGHMETYTDGVSSFSIFVKPGEGGQQSDSRIKQAVASKGATKALITSRNDGGELQHISIVGELPLSVAQKISLSVRRIAGIDASSGS